MKDLTSLIEKIHATPHKAVMVVAGAGTQALAWVLGVPGASRTVLEALVPYGSLAMIDFLGHEPGQFVSPQTARELAKAAYHRGMRLREDDSPVVGLACTATIATDRPKRGDHRCSIAAWDEAGVIQYDLLLDKDKRSRAGEEEVVSRLVVHTLAQACGIETELSLGLTDAEHPEVQRSFHPDPIQRLLAGEANSVTVYPNGRMAVDESLQGAILPGSFSPLHYGHEQLAQVASEILGLEVIYELSVVNVDKPPLEEAEVRRRVGQFAGKARVALTRAETFYKKARLFPGSTFVIGCDTAVRLVEPRYYDGKESVMLTALAEMWAAGIRFLVAGREQKGRFRALADVPIPSGFRYLFQEIPESQFRADVSSTALRAGIQGTKDEGRRTKEG
jgi:hypothetical protein